MLSLPQFGVSPNGAFAFCRGCPENGVAAEGLQGRLTTPKGTVGKIFCVWVRSPAFLHVKKSTITKNPTTSVFLLLSARFVLLLICLHFPLFRPSLVIFLKGWKKTATWYLCSQFTELPQHWGMENERDWRGEKTNGVPVPLRNKRMTFSSLSCFSKSVHKMKKGEEAKQGSAAPGKTVVCCSPCARCIIKPKIEQWTEGGWWGTGPSRRGQGCLL